MIDLFLELDLINYDIEGLADKFRLYDLYLIDFIDLSFKDLLKRLDLYYFFDVDYLEFNSIMVQENKRLLRRALEEMQEIKNDISERLELKEKLLNLIVGLSKLSKDDLKTLFNIYNSIQPIKEDIYVFSNNNGVLEVNPLFGFMCQDMLDFIKYLINARYNRDNRNLSKLYYDYDEQDDLTK